MKTCEQERDELRKALADLVESCGHIPVLSAFGSDGSVLAIRRAGKYLAAFERAQALCEQR